MTKEEIFEVWAPAAVPWSPWVKPVLFACMNAPLIGMPPAPNLNLSGLPPAGESALVLDLPGADGVLAGLVAAAHGYRPVPLYNAVPGPAVVTAFSSGSGAALVNVDSIIAALWNGTAELQQISLPWNAPPAFLLDANRRGVGMFASPGRFDNRSISFTTDFPSATFLWSHGIRRALVIQTASHLPEADLSHTLCRWQEAGIGIELMRVDLPGAPLQITVTKPSGFGLLWHRALELVGLRRHGLGGFGGFVPEPSSGG